MSGSDSQLVSVSSAGPATGIMEGLPAETGSDPFRLILGFLQRHWKWVLPLAAILAIAGSLAGYRAVSVKYRSTGYIRIRPIMPRVLYQTEQAGVMPMFDAFVESQVTLINSQRVLTMAVQNPSWKALGHGTTPEAVEVFGASLEVGHPRGSEVIIVAFTDQSVAAATAGVNALIEAYQKIYTEADGTQSAQTLQLLESRKTTLTADLKELNDRVLSLGNEFGSTALGRLYDFKLTDLSKLESELQQVQVAIALASGRDAVQHGTTQPVSQDAEAIARSDPDMRDYLRQRQALARKLELLKLRFLPSHRDVIEAQAELDNLSREISLYAERYRLRPGGTSVADGSGIAIESIEQLNERERNLSVLVERARQSTRDLGRKRLQIESLQSEVEEKRKRLAETDARLEQLSVESGVGGRLSILSYGETPTAPYNDKRKQAAAGGALGGALLGIGVPLLIGLTNRRCASIADARDTTRRAGRLLGILPSLPDDLSDPEQAATAAHYVHHIRVLLQLGTHGSGPVAMAITSSASGSGKTSLTQALGLSFAASGAKTLIVDCDIVGGGLTRRMETAIRQKLGQILLREGLVSSRDLDEALRISHTTRRRLGEVLVERGLVAEDDILRAMQIQKRIALGLSDMLAGGAPADCIAATGIKDLSLLPLGAADPQQIARLSPGALRLVLDEAKKSFDVILIDTGPVPGSIEASMVAAEADQVVMVVSRGEHRQPVHHALDYLQALGANVAGVVFNRAKADDMEQSGYSSRVSEPLGEDRVPQDQDGFARLGPVARAVATVGGKSEHGERWQP